MLVSHPCDRNITVTLRGGAHQVLAERQELQIDGIFGWSALLELLTCGKRPTDCETVTDGRLHGPLHSVHKFSPM